MFDSALFIGFPYVAVAIAVVVSIYRYRTTPFTYSSQSSELLENRKLFFGSVPWHYGIILILFAHLIPLLFPGLWAQITADQTRLYILEIIGLSFGLMALVGLVILVLRRLTNERARAVTSIPDWLLLFFLLLQVGLGFWVAYYYRWGSDWYLHIAVPWLMSLITFQPDISSVVALPDLVKLHFINGFIVILLLPFTRLVHLLTFPITYVWRKNQVVIWNRRANAKKS